MEDRLKGLRKSMENTTFKKLNFSEQHRKQVHDKINKQYENEDELLLAVLHLLIHEKTGYELTQLLRARGIQRFEENEGFIYTMLHRLEQTSLIKSSWDSKGNKYYQIINKGRKILRNSEKSSAKKLNLINQLIQE